VPNESERGSDTSCVVVAICGSDTLDACITRLRRLDPPPAEIVVSAANSFEIPARLEAAGDLKIVRANDDSPVTLATAGIAAATRSIICLTEDHCIPDREWIRHLSETLPDGSRVAAGGPIDAREGITSFDWAFFIVDFFRYLPPVAGGPVESLSVCNVAYRRETLSDIRAEWAPGFHETRVHEMLKRRGALFMVPAARVTSNRMVRVRDGVRERFIFGWLFAARRFRTRDAWRRIPFALGAVMLPFLLFARITSRCAGEGRLAKRLVKSTPHVMLLLIAWTLGELLGYVSGSPPASSPAARNRASLSADHSVNA
jgi:hypothetical protein